jgi:hypothetical protein
MIRLQRYIERLKKQMLWGVFLLWAALGFTPLDYLTRLVSFRSFDGADHISVRRADRNGDSWEIILRNEGPRLERLGLKLFVPPSATALLYVAEGRRTVVWTQRQPPELNPDVDEERAIARGKDPSSARKIAVPQGAEIRIVMNMPGNCPPSAPGFEIRADNLRPTTSSDLRVVKIVRVVAQIMAAIFLVLALALAMPKRRKR